MGFALLSCCFPLPHGTPLLPLSLLPTVLCPVCLPHTGSYKSSCISQSVWHFEFSHLCFLRLILFIFPVFDSSFFFLPAFYSVTLRLRYIPASNFYKHSLGFLFFSTLSCSVPVIILSHPVCLSRFILFIFSASATSCSCSCLSLLLTLVSPGRPPLSLTYHVNKTFPCLPHP